MVEYPPGEPQEECAICGDSFESIDSEFASNYANLVCKACDERAVTEQVVRPERVDDDLDPEVVIEKEDGSKVIRVDASERDNPVFIDNQKCWRRYRFSGWVTRRDDHDCKSLEEFYEKHRGDY